jgi:hypothetical protein
MAREELSSINNIGRGIDNNNNRQHHGSRLNRLIASMNEDRNQDE